MFSSQKPKEEKTENSPAFCSAWEKPPVNFQQILLLSDEIHFAVANLRDLRIEIWNSQNQQLIRRSEEMPHLTLMALLHNGDLVVAHGAGNIYQVQSTDLKSTLLFTAGPLNALAVLDNGFLVTGHDNGLIHIWDLAKHEKKKSIRAGTYAITALESRHDGSLIIGNTLGHIYINDMKNNLSFPFIDTSAVACIVALPDNNAVFGSRSGMLTLCDFDKKNHRYMRLNEAIKGLVVMRDGLIGCLTENTLQFFKPSWIQQYIDQDNEVKKVINLHFPSDVTNIIADYANIDFVLFKHPKQPNKRECLLAARPPKLVK